MSRRSSLPISLGCTLLVLCACRTAGLQRAYMALDDSGDRHRTTFDTQTKAIFCVGELASGRTDVTVSAQIRATALFDPASGQIVAANVTMAAEETAPGQAEHTIVSF